MKGLGSPYDALLSCNGKKVLKYPYFHSYTPCALWRAYQSIFENLFQTSFPCFPFLKPKKILSHISIGFNYENGLYINICYFPHMDL